MTPGGSNQAIYRRWRAQTFADIVGQTAVVETLRNAVRTDRVAHAILFAGPRGTGKTSLARILAKAVNCLDLQDGDACDRCEACVAIREGTTLDVIEIDAASNNGIEAIRDLRERLAYPPGHLRRKVYILDEAHQVTGPAWNAFLKSLEEPPEFVQFVFASTDPTRFPMAILSRLQRFDVRRLTVPEIEGKLARILESDQRTADPAAVRLVAGLAAGGMRDAESMLDQLLATPGTIDEARVRDLLGLADAEVIDAFVAALVDRDAVAGIARLDGLEEHGRDIRKLLDQVVEALRTRITEQLATDGTVEPALTDAARRVAAIDPERAGLGGLRLQLELALLAPGPAAPDRPVARRVAVTTATEPPTTTEPPTAPEPLKASQPPRIIEPDAEPVDPPAPIPVMATPGDATSGPRTDGDLGRLQGSWTEIVAAVSPAVRAVISECRPMSVEGSVVTLGFPETKGFLKDVAERNRPRIEEAIGGSLGRPVTVRTVATNLEPTSVDSADLIAEARRIYADDLVDVTEIE